MDRGGDDGDDFEGMLPEDNLAEDDAAGSPADLLDDKSLNTAATLPQTTNQKKKAKHKQVRPFSDWNPSMLRRVVELHSSCRFDTV